MIAEAAASPIGHNGGPAIDEPQPALMAVNFPGVCMGATVLMSLGMMKIGFGPLTEAEGKQLTDALLKMIDAYEISIGNKKVAATLDLAGVMTAILLPRIMADIERRKKPASPTQQAAAENNEPIAA